MIVIVTDDLDYDSINEMPNLRSLMIERGTTFENSFVSNSLCCPSRATFFRGQYTHNHGVLSNKPPEGGFQKFRELGRQNSTLSTWLDDHGYQTALFGKYLNGTPNKYDLPGWDVRGDIGSKTESVYPTDWYSDQALAFLEERENHSTFRYLLKLHTLPPSLHHATKKSFRT